MNTHLDALQLRLSNERMHYASDKRPIRKVWIDQIEKEIAGELSFLGIADDISDDDLLIGLFA